MEKLKVAFITALSALMSWWGILAVPVLLLLGSNLIDYATGIAAAKNRKEAVNSYKGMRGIIKKVCMYLLIVVGSFVDILINYAIEYMGMTFTFPFVASTIIAVWLVVNEIISILENIRDIGVDMPPFLMPVIKYIKKQVEDKASMMDDDKEEQKS